MRPMGTSTESSGANPISYTVSESWGDVIVVRLILRVRRDPADLQGESVDFLEDDQSERYHGAPLKRGASGRIMTRGSSGSSPAIFFFFWKFWRENLFQTFENSGGDLVRPRSQNLASPISDVAPPSTLIRITAEIVETMGGFPNLRRWNPKFRRC
jgi:hypothetical protein